MEETNKQDKMEEIDLNKLKDAHPLLSAMVESGLITSQGIPQYGGGIRINLLEKILERLDKIEKHCWRLSKDMEKIAPK